MQNQITFSQALEGYLLYADACRLSPHTIADYANTFRKFQIFLKDDPPIASITADHVRAFFVRLVSSDADYAAFEHPPFSELRRFQGVTWESSTANKSLDLLVERVRRALIYQRP